uniref:Uncharacterized protein n=1 Tax=Parascaris equorum TaxID=6256 RepID=A0A914RMM3_PAREQ
MLHLCSSSGRNTLKVQKLVAMPKYALITKEYYVVCYLGGGCTFLSNSHIIEYDTKENDVSVVAEVVKAEDHPTPLDMGHSGSKNDKETGNIDETAKPRKKLFSFSRKKKSAELETNSNYAKRKKDAKSADADKSDGLLSFVFFSPQHSSQAFSIASD